MVSLFTVTGDDINSQWRWVAKVSLFTGVGAMIILAVLLVFLGKSGDGNYFDLIRAHSLTRHQLGDVMLLGGALSLVVIGLSAWLIALYASFRIAGPLYRFQENLDAARDRQPLLNIRQGDALQDVSNELQHAVRLLYAHYDEISLLVDELENSPYPVVPVKLTSSVKMRESHQQNKPLIYLDPSHNLTRQFVAVYDSIIDRK